MANYIGNQPLNGEFKRLDSIESQFNNSSTSFGLKYNNVSQTVGDASQLIVSLNGVIQEPLTSYTLSGVTNIVFASPPANGDTCFIILLGGIGGTVTPSDNSVSTAKLTNNSVTSAKIVNNTITADDMDSSDNYAFNNITVATNTLVTDATNDRIGVGTANPTYPLDVEDAGAGFIKGSFVSTGSAHSTISFDNTGSDAASVRVGSNNNDFYVRTSGSEKMRVTSGGNVGVGSSSPSKKLDILTSGSYDGIQVSNSSTSTAARLQLNNDNSKSLQIDVGSSAQSTYGPYIADTVAIVANSAPLNIGTDTSTHVALYTNLSERMRIDNSGNVGIGSSSPTEKLVVNGAIGSSNQSLGFSSGPHRVAMDIINASKIARIGTITGTATPTGDEGTVTFLVNSSEKMRINNNGLLMVGQTSGSTSGAGSLFTQTGKAYHIVTGDTPLFVDRKSNDGQLVEFRRDQTVVGSLRARAGLVSTIILDPRTAGAGFTGAGDGSSNRHIVGTNEGGTEVDGAVSLGKSGVRFKDLYLSGGVYVGGTGSANYLDDYEEGTWTPTFVDGTVTTNNSSGEYTKVGNSVFVNINLSVNGVSSLSTSDVGTLPFTPNEYTTMAVFPITGFEQLGAMLCAQPATNGRIQLYYVNNASGNNYVRITDAHLNEGSQISLRIAGVYTTNS